MQSLEDLPFVGGSPALDFVNTAEERGHPLCGEVLHTPDDLRNWGRRYGLVDPTASSADQAGELTRSIAARELLYRLWFAHAHANGPADAHANAPAHVHADASADAHANAPAHVHANANANANGNGNVHAVDSSDLQRLARLTAQAHRAGQLEPTEDGLRWQWDRSDLASIRHIAITSAVELLTAPRRARIKQCPGDHCGWFFLDTTKRGNRRWCLMSECGQAAKSAGRRQRTTTTASSGGLGR